MKNKPFLVVVMCRRSKEAVGSEASTHLFPTTTVVTQILLPTDLPHLRTAGFSQLSSLMVKFKMRHFLFLQQLSANFLIKASSMCQKKIIQTTPVTMSVTFLSSDINHRLIQLSQHDLLLIKPVSGGCKPFITWCLHIDFIYSVLET